MVTLVVLPHTRRHWMMVSNWAVGKNFKRQNQRSPRPWGKGKGGPSEIKDTVKESPRTVP